MPELVIFDLDGTLVDSKHDIAEAVNLTLDELDIPRRAPELVHTYIGGGVHNLVRRSLTDEFEHMLEKGVDLFWANYKAHILDRTEPYPGVYKMLEGFSGTKLALVTNKPYDHTMLILRGLDLDRYFASVQGWKMGLPLKPEPELIIRAMQEAECAGKDAVMVGDGTADVLAAKAAGIKSCAVGYGYGSKDRLMEAGPDFFADTVPDIERLLG
ncbi:MAG: HAD-IA family hydrolase [Nitrospirae bacterium]|nr:HAD-IA family hydrolase [Nitrospirota bacterium]